MQTPDEKTKMFLDMQEHPEKYSDWQIEAMMEELDQMPDVEKEWNKFEQRHKHTTMLSSRRWMKIAATFVGMFLVSSIALAAIHIIQQISDKRKPKATNQEVYNSKKRQQIISADTIKPDTTAAELRIFENVPLDSMLIEIAGFYHVGIEFQDDEKCQLRFHFIWKRNESIDKVVERLNNFEVLNITQEPDKLIVR